MRVSLLLLFIVIAQLHAENLYSQSTVINLSLRNVTVEQVLDRIEKDTEFSFLFTDKSVDTDRIVDMNIHSKNINETLKILFGGTDVSYRIVDRQVILSKKKEGRKTKKSERLHFQRASFLRFIAAYLSLTHAETRARPRWCV